MKEPLSSYLLGRKQIQQGQSVGGHTAKEELKHRFELWFPGLFLRPSSKVMMDLSGDLNPGSLARGPEL